MGAEYWMVMVPSLVLIGIVSHIMTRQAGDPGAAGAGTAAEVLVRPKRLGVYVAAACTVGPLMTVERTITWWLEGRVSEALGMVVMGLMFTGGYVWLLRRALRQCRFDADGLVIELLHWKERIAWSEVTELRIDELGAIFHVKLLAGSRKLFTVESSMVGYKAWVASLDSWDTPDAAQLRQEAAAKARRQGKEWLGW